jgi:hypothetical protein
MIRHNYDNLSESSKRQLRLGLLRESVPGGGGGYGPGNGWRYDPNLDQSVPIDKPVGTDEGSEEGSEDGTETGTDGTDGPQTTWCLVNGVWQPCNGWPIYIPPPKPVKRPYDPKDRFPPGHPLAPVDGTEGGTDGGGPTPSHTECEECPPIGPNTVGGAFVDSQGNWWTIVDGVWVPCPTCGP